MADLTPGSSEWWIAHLWQRLDARARRISLYERYYNGQQDLRFTTYKAREVFGHLFAGFADNFCALVVDALDERLRVRGFRVGNSAEADSRTSDIWRNNDMAGQSRMAHLEALVNEESYAIVWTGPDRATPVISIESPFEVITEHDAAQRRVRKAALKRWYDEDAERWRVCLYLPAEIRKYEQAQPGKAEDAARRVTDAGFWRSWQPEGDPEWPLPNPLGVVPVVPFTNQPRLGPGQRGTSALAQVVPLQDAINKTIFDMIIASEYAAYPQRYMVGVAQPVDPVTGDPVEPFKAGVDRIWFIETDQTTGVNPNVGQFPAADLRPYVEAVDMYVEHLAGITKTPKHYLVDAGGGTNLSGETVKALEAGLVSKARRTMDDHGPVWEEVMAMALRLVEGGAWTPADATRLTCDWEDPETRTEAQHVDALVKLGSPPIGVPQEALWEQAGYSSDEIARFREMQDAQAARRQPAPAAPAAAPGAAPAATGAPMNEPVQPAAMMPGPGPLPGQ